MTGHRGVTPGPVSARLTPGWWWFGVLENRTGGPSVAGGGPESSPQQEGPVATAAAGADEGGASGGRRQGWGVRGGFPPGCARRPGGARSEVPGTGGSGGVVTTGPRAREICAGGHCRGMPEHLPATPRGPPTALDRLWLTGSRGPQARRSRLPLTRSDGGDALDEAGAGRGPNHGLFSPSGEARSGALLGNHTNNSSLRAECLGRRHSRKRLRTGPRTTSPRKLGAFGWNRARVNV